MKNTVGPAPWVIVAGGVHRLGGTDKANFALVDFLLETGVRVHVVTHRIDPELACRAGICVELVPIPAGSWFAGERLLSAKGRHVARRVTAEDPRARVVVNGGNCLWPDINWVHCVHHAWSRAKPSAPWAHRLKQRVAVSSARRREAANLRATRLIIANSELTRRHLIDFLGLDPSIIHTVYLGAETQWAPAGDAERIAARDSFGLDLVRPLVTFIGAIGYDNNKGLDTLWRAWQQLCSLPDWDADLVVAGEGRALGRWEAAVAASGVRDRVRFLGFTDRTAELLAAADLLVSPVRYESYGLNVQEALCRGVPAIASASAGVAERYPSYLRDLLLPDPEDADDLVHRMLLWRSNPDHWRDQVVKFSKDLRTYSWHDMAECFYARATGAPAPNAELRPVAAAVAI